ncbi:hypothetical protein D6764_05475 [Candidatus Woesearchaeota archaeon]|nr:MAG: hypothetical protein D6764_05475 [Candidatus Woesearchaeota archaeon]
MARKRLRFRHMPFALLAILLLVMPVAFAKESGADDSGSSDSGDDSPKIMPMAEPVQTSAGTPVEIARLRDAIRDKEGVRSFEECVERAMKRFDDVPPAKIKAACKLLSSVKDKPGVEVREEIKKRVRDKDGKVEFREEIKQRIRADAEKHLERSFVERVGRDIPPEKLRELAKRKGKVVRIAEIDGKKYENTYNFEA